ncbi:hypothetical protein Leryth_001310 [Lithospermum erythrorhizon]|nr:hypothetical protein Leryth_001310 [Lithospermum erythrorhizon]
MAQIHRNHFPLSTFFVLYLIPFALSRSSTYTDSMHYQELDVKSSMQKTKAIFNLSPQTIQEEGVAETPSSELSFTLHPRAAIVAPKEKDYAAVTKARLARDSARVASLMTQHQLSLKNLTTQDLNPADTSLGPEKIQAPLTSGANQGSGEYFTRVGVGRPVKQFYMVIDTGSDISWLQCKPCTECYEQSDPIFNPGSSTTYKSVGCSSQQCNALRVSACQANSCLYQVSYGDGSYTVGDFATESVTFGSASAKSIPNVAIGCGHQNEGLFIGAAGLLGLGHGKLSFPTQIKTTSFSYCLVQRDSSASSTLDFDSAPPRDSVTVPLLRNPKINTFYYLPLAGLAVGGRPVSLPESVFAFDSSGYGGVIIDSGTAVTRLQTAAYNSLRDSFVKLSQHLPKSSSFALFDTCYDLSSMSSVTVPTVAFRFGGGKTVALHPKNYLIPVDSAGKYCFAFAPTSGSLAIIGNIQQQGTRVSYDLANNVVGFSPDKC